MSTSRIFDRICVLVTVAALVLTILFMNGQALGLELVTDADSEAHSDNTYFTENDQTADWDTTSATVITLEGDTASIDGANAYVYDGNVVIAGSGKFVVTGTLDDGYLSVAANANSKVWILFQGVDITCSNNTCLRVEEADKVFLTLAEGTQNSLTGGEELSEEAEEDGSYGVIFSHDDLTINGNGVLTITAGYKHGIKANDDLVITGGCITIDAPADGIHVNDSFRLMEADLTITAGDDGILTENEESFFYMESGSVTAQAQGDGIHSAGDITIAGGSLILDAGDDAVHADGGVSVSDGTILVNSCYEGIEALTIDVSGGEITIYPTDDGFNASGGSGSSTMTGVMQAAMPGTEPAGEYEQPQEDGSAGAAGDEGAPDEAQTEAADDMQETETTDRESSGMEDTGREAVDPEGRPMELAGTETDDAGTETDTVDTWIHISGGTVTIINENGNDADGLDSNGDIIISGGTVRISLTNNGTNSAIDVGTESGGSAQITGGTVIACGSYSMAEGFDSSSTQCSVLYNISSGMEAGTDLCLEAEDGSVLLAWEVPCSFSSAIISCPEMTLDETYTVVAGEQEEAVTLTETAASFGDAQSTMFGGNMNWGGMQQRDGMQERPDGHPGTEPESSEVLTEADGTSAESAQSFSAPAEDGPMSGERPEGENGMQGFGGGPGMQQESTASETAQTAEDAAILSYDRSVYVLLAASVLVLLLGLVIAICYRK